MWNYEDYVEDRKFSAHIVVDVVVCVQRESEGTTDWKERIMKVCRANGFYRPYFIEVNGTGHYVHNIHFYDESGVVVSSGFGWLERKYNTITTDIEEIELPVDEIKLRRKEKFDGVVFAMTKKDDFGDTRYELYIPCDMLNICFVEYILKYDQVRKVYKGSNDIYISEYVKSVDVKLNEIRSEYERLYKDVSDSALYIEKPEIVLAKLEKMMELTKQYKAEQKRVHELTIDDIEL